MANTIIIQGMVDPHVHLRDLDWAHKATFASETTAAVAGGYWAVFDMPNTPPTTITQGMLDAKFKRITAGAVCDWGVYFGASQRDNSAEYPQVAEKVCGLKMFCNATTGDLLLNDQTMREQHFKAWPQERIIAVHAEGKTVAEILSLVQKYRKRTHFLHISTAEEMAYLADAKAEGLPITIGVCPHHLYLSENDLPALGSLGLMKPELKTPKDQESLWHGLQSGLIDVVESDHAPHTLEEKASAKPPYGVPGLETTLPLLLLAVQENRLSLERVIELVADSPRRIWGLKCPADTYTVVDLDATYLIDRASLHTRCGWSPFEGMRVFGKVCETRIRGQQVYDGEKITARPGFGRNLFWEQA